MKIAVQSCDLSVAAQDLNDGWMIDKGKYTIKWEVNMKEIKKSLKYKKKIPLVSDLGCKCKMSCSLSHKMSTSCHSYSHKGQQRDADNDLMPCPRT